MARAELSNPLGAKYPQFYTMESNLRIGSPLIQAALPMDAKHVAEMLDPLQLQLPFASKCPEPIQIIEITGKGEDVTYTDKGIWDKVEEPIYDESERSYLWVVKREGSSVEEFIYQREISQVLPPDIAHSYFRLILDSTVAWSEATNLETSVSV